MRQIKIETAPAGKRAYPGAEFEAIMRSTLDRLRDALPAVEWQADFALGPRDHVEIFSAPNEAIARQLCALAGTVEGIRAEVSALRSAWR